MYKNDLKKFMKRYPNGSIILDVYDIVLWSFAAGSTLGIAIKWYRRKTSKDSPDPIINELKTTSSRMALTENNQFIKLNFITLSRGGEDYRRIVMLANLILKNKRLAKFIRSIVQLQRHRNQLRLLAIFFGTVNRIVTNNFGFYIHAATYVDYTQFMLLAVGSGSTGLILALFLKHSAMLTILSYVSIYVRGIQDILPEESNFCKTLCLVAEQVHNQKIKLEMTELIPIIKPEIVELEVPVYVCLEEKLSLVQRYRLQKITGTRKGDKQVQYFNEFIKKFTACDPDQEAIYENIKQGKI
jgi:hypothetical protein